MPFRFVCAALAALPAAAAAQSFGYQEFEPAVVHIDLAECPSEIARDGVFCRATLANDGVHVFVFDAEGEQSFVEMRSYYDEEIAALFE